MLTGRVARIAHGPMLFDVIRADKKYIASRIEDALIAKLPKSWSDA
jgi:hypothetical protein